MIRDNARPVDIWREEGPRGLSRCRKLGPELNADIVITCPGDRRALVAPMKPVF